MAKPKAVNKRIDARYAVAAFLLTLLVGHGNTKTMPKNKQRIENVANSYD